MEFFLGGMKLLYLVILVYYDVFLQGLWTSVFFIRINNEIILFDSCLILKNESIDI